MRFRVYDSSEVEFSPSLDTVPYQLRTVRLKTAFLGNWSLPKGWAGQLSDTQKFAALERGFLNRSRKRFGRKPGRYLRTLSRANFDCGSLVKLTKKNILKCRTVTQIASDLPIGKRMRNIGFTSCADCIVR